MAFQCLFNAVDGDKQDLEAKGNFCPVREGFFSPVLGSNFWGWHWEPVTSDKELSWAPALLSRCSG